MPWPEIRDAFAWVRRLADVPQDAVHHAEGDVETHTRMACEALASLPEWRSRPPGERVRLFAAVLMHDIAKPDCTRTEDDGRITAHGHSRRGDLAVRRVLWELGAPIAWREHVAGLVRHHQVPFWALERSDLQKPVLYARNRARTSPVPDAVIDRLAGRWELPDPTEAHQVHWLSTA